MRSDPTLVPTTTDGPEIWKAWYDSLKSNFGKKTANLTFVRAWKRFGGTNQSSNDLREHLKKNGIEIPTTWGQDIVDKGTGVTDFFGDYFQVGKYVGLTLAVIAVGGIAMVVYNLAKNPAQSAGTALKAYGGRV